MNAKSNQTRTVENLCESASLWLQLFHVQASLIPLLSGSNIRTSSVIERPFWPKLDSL
jgi:hypothetical protein